MDYANKLQICPTIADLYVTVHFPTRSRSHAWRGTLYVRQNGIHRQKVFPRKAWESEGCERLHSY